MVVDTHLSVSKENAEVHIEKLRDISTAMNNSSKKGFC